MPGGGRTTGVIGPSGRPLLRCDWCRGLWDPGTEKDCAICKSYPPLTKGKKKGLPRVSHGNHSMCFTCFGVYARARKRNPLSDADLKHIARASNLRQKLVGEKLLIPPAPDLQRSPDRDARDTGDGEATTRREG